MLPGAYLGSTRCRRSTVSGSSSAVNQVVTYSYVGGDGLLTDNQVATIAGRPHGYLDQGNELRVSTRSASGGVGRGQLQRRRRRPHHQLLPAHALRHHPLPNTAPTTTPPTTNYYHRHDRPPTTTPGANTGGYYDI